MNGRWISTWAASQQRAGPADLPAWPASPSVVFAGSTLRQTLRVTLGGQRIRLRLSNAYGDADLRVTEVWVARPRGGLAGVSTIGAGTSRPVTFGGLPGVAVPAGAEVASDPVDWDAAAGANLTVTMYLALGQAAGGITSHPGSRTTSYIAAGNHVSDGDLAGAAAADHWYFLSGAEAWVGQAAAAVAIIGDSLTDGRGSTTNGNDRWPDHLFAGLQSSQDTSGIAVLNLGIGGNRVLSDGLGPAALSRLDRDVFGCSGLRWLIVFEGVNDIGTVSAARTEQQNAADALIGAYRWMSGRARAFGILIFAATLTPFGGHETL
jgi:lysophospholipase L1-like esterase